MVFQKCVGGANYKNALLGIDYTPIYLERFFRNLLLAEQWDLRNRYLHIHATDECKEQPNLAEPINALEIPDKYRTSTVQVESKLHSDNYSIVKIVLTIGGSQMSVREMMSAIGLKHRENFLANYLNPAISEGYIRLLYPDSPRHPRQRYLLTAKGMELYNAHHD